ncbi:unnamed protein product, partial [Iphiclides podalirius]
MESDYQATRRVCSDASHRATNGREADRQTDTPDDFRFDEPGRPPHDFVYSPSSSKNESVTILGDLDPSGTPRIDILSDV